MPCDLGNEKMKSRESEILFIRMLWGGQAGTKTLSGKLLIDGIRSVVKYGLKYVLWMEDHL